MKTAILTVGTEILFGQILNTNAQYLSQKLNLLGFDVMYHYTVGDNTKRLAEMIEEIFRDCDIIITTGGLGPTQDDLTKETIASVMGEKLVLHKESMEYLEEYARKRGRPLTENNYKQAYMPEHGTVLRNTQGSAPGFAIEKNGKIVVSMPGPPREMHVMFEDEVVPYLEKFQDGVIRYKMMRTIGIGESLLETILMPLIDGQTDPTLATYAKDGECSLRIASKRATAEEAEQAIEEMAEKVRNLIGYGIYSENNEDLVDVTGRMLIEKKISISCAESCTGGLFAQMITSVPGISAVFDRGLVTYTEKAKMDELGVERETLEKYTAVSHQTAAQMAAGLYDVTGSDICISVTGYAGPDGGTEKDPVGTFYVGICHKGKTQTHRCVSSPHSRAYVRNYAALTMLHYVFDIVKTL